MKCKAHGGGFLGSESKFIVPLARPSGAMLCIVMKLASDPNNPLSHPSVKKLKVQKSINA
jgi:hypothetical protein